MNQPVKRKMPRLVLLSRVFFTDTTTTTVLVQLLCCSTRTRISTQLQQAAVTLARTRISTQLQQPAVRSRKKAGTEEGKAVGVQQAEGDTRVNSKQHKKKKLQQRVVGPRHLRGATTAPQRSSRAASRTEASPQDPPCSGSTRSASARDPESVRTGIGPAEAGGRDPHRKHARSEGRGPEIGGEWIPV